MQQLILSTLSFKPEGIETFFLHYVSSDRFGNILSDFPHG